MLRRIISKINLVFLPLVLLVGFVSTSLAANHSTSGTLPGPGDRKQLDTFMYGFTLADGSDNQVFYAPPKAILWVDTKEDKEGYVTVHFPDCTGWGCKGLTKPEKIPASYENKPMVSQNVEYKIESSKLQNYPAQSRGIDYGLLVVPFKFHLSDQSLTGEATLGGYAGYQMSWPGIAITFPVISAGVGIVNTRQQSGTSTSDNAPSFTVAGGLIVNLIKSGLFQIGIIAGADWAGKGSNYKYEGEPWIAVSFGTNFTK